MFWIQSGLKTFLWYMFKFAVTWKHVYLIKMKKKLNSHQIGKIILYSQWLGIHKTVRPWPFCQCHGCQETDCYGGNENGHDAAQTGLSHGNDGQDGYDGQTAAHL